MQNKVTAITSQLCQQFLSTAVVQPALCATQSCRRPQAKATAGPQEAALFISSHLTLGVTKVPTSSLAMT